MQQVESLAPARLQETDVLPPQLLDVLDEANQDPHALHVAEARGQLRKARRRRASKARTEQNVGVLTIVLVEALEQMEQVLTRAGSRLL